MSKTYSCPIEVRGYELDSFGHVNHAQYIHYLEHARWVLLQEERIGLAEFKKWKRWPVIASLEVSYLKPTFMGDALRVETRLEPSGRLGFLAHQTIFRDDKAVLNAVVQIVTVNEHGKPAELPDEVSQAFFKTEPSA